jgi:glucose-6-phosphate isomerase
LLFSCLPSTFSHFLSHSVAFCSILFTYRVSSAIGKVVDFGIKSEYIFGFWDWVGGRYSVCSAVGVLPLSLQYGMDVVKQFLAGAHNMDSHFFEAPLRSNLPVILGLLGVWNSSFLGYSARAILPCKP